jgi:hypothetical protein
MLDDAQLLAHLADQARLLTDTFARCDPATPVPGLDWNTQTGGSAAFWPSAADAPGLAAWLDEGVAILLAALRNAPTSLTCSPSFPRWHRERSGSVGRPTRQRSIEAIWRARPAAR